MLFMVGSVADSESMGMAFMRGKPLIAKVAALATYVVFPAAMVAAVIYSPPSYTYSNDNPKSTK